MKSQNDYYEEAIRSEVLSKELICTLLESLEYPNMSFINWTIEMLHIIKTRVERGDKITDEVSHMTYNMTNFHDFVQKNFSSYICSQVFDDPKKAQKVYFTLEECDDGEYNLVMASSSKAKTYRWISSLSERFSLVEMIATGIVYVKDVKNDTYAPFISKNGKYCRYNKEKGHIVEIQW